MILIKQIKEFSYALMGWNSIHQSIYLSIYLSIYQSINQSINQSISQSSSRYTGEGMDEMEFTEAESNMNDLVSEYQVSTMIRRMLN
jgi:hypothetical protein